GALAGKDVLACARCDDRPGNSVGAVYSDGGVAGVDGGNDVDCSVERPLGGGVVRASGRIRPSAPIFLTGSEVDLGKAEPREAGDDARRHPLAGRIDNLGTRRKLHSDVASSEDPAIPDDHHPVRYRLRSVTESHGTAADCVCLGARWGRSSKQQGERDTPDHFVSPSPGWPSSKSLTGRRFGSLASYISAPSIQTICGLE